MIDRETLIAYLQRRAGEAGTGRADTTGGMLALYAAYQGLAEQIKNGDFDVKED